jgi:hypothetical protein
MKSITLQSHVGADGILRLQVPVNWADTDLEVMVIVQPIAPSQTAKPNGERKRPTPEELGWPTGFFEQTFGSWQGEPLEREPQGEYEIREELQ